MSERANGQHWKLGMREREREREMPFNSLSTDITSFLRANPVHRMAYAGMSIRGTPLTAAKRRGGVL